MKIIPETIDDVVAIVASEFRSFGGGGGGGSNNPIAIALKDQPAQFAAGVDIKDVAARMQELLLQMQSAGKPSYWMIQQGGSSGEYYVKGFDTREESDDHRIECGREGVYETSPTIEVAPGLIAFPGFTDAMQEIVDSTNELKVVEGVADL